jgi:hypothetical protein
LGFFHPMLPEKAHETVAKALPHLTLEKYRKALLRLFAEKIEKSTIRHLVLTSSLESPLSHEAAMNLLTFCKKLINNNLFNLVDSRNRHLF